MQFHTMPRCHSTGDKAATGLQTFEAGIPHWGANMFEDDIHPLAVSKRPHPLQDVFTRVIDPGLCRKARAFSSFSGLLAVVITRARECDRAEWRRC